MIPMEPRRPGCAVVEGKRIDAVRVRALASAADRCWAAILARDLAGFAAAYRASFEAQVAMFPGMVQPVIAGPDRQSEMPGQAGHDVQSVIDQWSTVPGVLAYKMPGAGGGGYLACVV